MSPPHLPQRVCFSNKLLFGGCLLLQILNLVCVLADFSFTLSRFLSKYIAQQGPVKQCHHKDVNCIDNFKESLCLVLYMFPSHLPQRECMYWRIFPSRSVDFSVNILPNKALLNMTQMDVLSMDVLSARCYVARRFVPMDVFSLRTFCLGMFFLRTFCLGTVKFTYSKFLE